MKITNKYVIEAIVFLSYVLFAMAWVGGTASLSQIMASMHVNSYASASFISGAVTLAKILGTFIAAWFALTLGIKRAFFIACILVVLGVITPIAPTFDMLLISRFLMGLGGALMIVYFNPIVMNLFTVDQRSTINGLNAVAFNVGTAIVLWFIPQINALTGDWQHSLMIFSGFSLLLAMVWYLVVLTDNEPSSMLNSPQLPSKKYGYLDGLKDNFTWIYALSYSGLLAFYICLFTFYPKAGISASKWVIGFGIIGTIAGIIYSKKIKQRIPIIRWSGAIQVVTVIGLSFSSSASIQTLCAIILGFAIFFPVTALISIPHELSAMTGEKITIIFSLFWSISYLVATIILWLFGKLIDLNHGEFGSAFVLISIVSSSLFIGSFLLPETNNNGKTLS